MTLNFDKAARRMLTGAVAFAAIGAFVAVGATQAQAWHHGKPHGGGYHDKWESSPNYHEKWRSREQQQYHGYGDYHHPKKSQYRKKKYYHQKYGSWGGHPQCIHLPFGRVCEY